MRNQPPSGPGDGPDALDHWIVLTADPVTGEIDAYGPLPESAAVSDAGWRRREFDDEGLHDVVVSVVRLHH